MRYKYGIELECYINENRRYDFEDQISGLPFEVDDDGSIEPSGYYAESMEIKSDGAMTYTEATTKTRELTEAMLKHKVLVNSSCGFHLHMSNEGFFKPQNIKRIVKLWLAMEDVLFATQPHHRHHNDYCVRRLRKHVLDEERSIPEQKDELIHELSRDSRYYAMNLTALGAHGTIEIRLHAGTTNYIRIVNWIDLFTAFFNYALSDDYSSELVQQIFEMPLSKKKADLVLRTLKVKENVRLHYLKRIVRNKFAPFIEATKASIELLKQKERIDLLKREQERVRQELSDIDRMTRNSRRVIEEL